MNILGISIGESCAASIMKNGEIIAAYQEERFTKKKNYSGFPKESIKRCLEDANLNIDEIDFIAMYCLHKSIKNLLYAYVQRRSSFSVSDYVREQNEYWYPMLYENKDLDYLEVFKDKLDTEQFPESFNKFFFERYKNTEINVKNSQEIIIKLIKSYYPSVDKEKIKFIPHHLAHALYSFYSFPSLTNNSMLIFVVDSFGDFENASIFEMKNRRIKVLHQLDNHNLGRLFRNITVYLGMKPYEHEYKVMGLAPYANEYQRKKGYEIFNKTMEVRDLDFFYKYKPPDNYFWFKKQLESVRFDGVAAGLQYYLEDRMNKWIKNVVNKFNIKDIILSGGIGMNIKLNMILGQQDYLNSFFVPASPDDTTTCIGACFAVAHQYNQEKIKLLKNMFLGNDISEQEIIDIIKEKNLNDLCNITYSVTPEFAATKLIQGKVIGRCSGKMEFGARSLGNRSILADPRNITMIERINKVIKKRDFWQPFSPVILDSCWDNYLINRNDIYSPYMTVGFDTTELGRRDLVAAIHPADKTTRPQMLIRKDNPYYYDIVDEFRKLTGVGGLLNTSFNLHGFPIVMNVKDTVNVFFQSDLDSLLLNNIYIEKK